MGVTQWFDGLVSAPVHKVKVDGKKISQVKADAGDSDDWPEEALLANSLLSYSMPKLSDDPDLQNLVIQIKATPLGKEGPIELAGANPAEGDDDPDVDGFQLHTHDIYASSKILECDAMELEKKPANNIKIQLKAFSGKGSKPSPFTPEADENASRWADDVALWCTIKDMPGNIKEKGDDGKLTDHAKEMKKKCAHYTKRANFYLTYLFGDKTKANAEGTDWSSEHRGCLDASAEKFGKPSSYSCKSGGKTFTGKGYKFTNFDISRPNVFNPSTSEMIYGSPIVVFHNDPKEIAEAAKTGKEVKPPVQMPGAYQPIWFWFYADGTVSNRV